VAIARGDTHTGSIPIKQLSRVRALLLRDDGQLDASVCAHQVGHGVAMLEGELRGSVWLECQRGLHPFEYRLDLSFSLRLATSEAEERRLLDVGEALLVDDDNLPLRQILEDELLLALPVAPRCEDSACAAP
jgi:uncharacterized protein